MMSRIIFLNLLFLTSSISIVITYKDHLEIIYILLSVSNYKKWVIESFIHNRRLFCYGTVYFYRREIKTSALLALCEGNPPVFGDIGLHWIPLTNAQWCRAVMFLWGLPKQIFEVPVSWSRQQFRKTITSANAIAIFTELIEACWRVYASVRWVIIDWRNGLSPVRRHVITWTSADL